jgi:uncharacterized LabA/DUF88 family protein
LAETKLKIAVFIDFDNIEIGVKTTLGSHFDAGAVLEAIKERGDVVTKIAYGADAGDYSCRQMQHAIHGAAQPHARRRQERRRHQPRPRRARDGVPHSHINTFVIVSGDSDFMALVEAEA